MDRICIQGREGKEKWIDLKEGVLKIGKNPDNHLVLKLAAISKYHCEIHKENGDCFVVDKGSTNGTYVAGQRIEGKHKLGDGEAIELGEYTLTYSAEEQATAAASDTPLPPTKTNPIPVNAGSSNGIPNELRKSLHRDLLGHLDLKRVNIAQLSHDEMREKTEAAVKNIVDKRRSDIPGNIPISVLIKDIVDQAIGLGPLENLLADSSVNEIMVNAYDKIYIERSGKIELSSSQFLDNQHVVEVIRRIIAPIGRRIDESSPMVDARLADGSRVNAIISPLAISGPSITIRKFSEVPLTVDNLIGFGSLTRNMATFLDLCIKHRMNLCISGGTGSGKTTLLNVLASSIPNDERIVTIEDAAELRLPQEHVVSLESKPPNIEGEGAIPIRKLVINSLRMRPDRIIVGECRAGEALDMLQAMNTGHDGSLTTLHANTCRDAIARLETMVLMSGMELPSKAILDQIASAVNIIVQTSRFADGKRRITHITAVVGMDGDTITLQDIFEFKQEGYDDQGGIKGKYVATGTIPDFIHDLRKRHIDVDLSIFQD